MRVQGTFTLLCDLGPASSGDIQSKSPRYPRCLICKQEGSPRGTRGMGTQRVGAAYLCGTGMRKRLSCTRTRTRMGGGKDGPWWVGKGGASNRLSQKT